MEPTDELATDAERSVLPLHRPKIGAFIVSYNASKTIGNVLERIKPETWSRIGEVFIFDDGSDDDTCAHAQAWKTLRGFDKVKIYRNRVNLGYGGNQKRGFRYAIRNRFDYIAILHGDGEYAPEALDQLLDPLVDREADAVIGSRMLEPGLARAAGMPLYKYLGNKLLTGMQNLLLGERISDYHSGYRAYSVAALARLPLNANSNDFHFDNELIVQLLEGRCRIREVPIPPYYGGGIRRLNGVRYAWNVVKTTVVYRLQKAGLFYDRKFDLKRGRQYTFKKNRYSSHNRIAEIAGVPQAGKTTRLLDVGCGGGFLAANLARQGFEVRGVDAYDSPEAREFCKDFVVADVEKDVGLREGQTVDAIVFADVLEHLRDPEKMLLNVRRHLPSDGRIIASTGNVAHIFIRLSLLLGVFRYTERGILDRTHVRLFTPRSFRRLFADCGYKIAKVRYCPIPFENIFPRWRRFADLLSAVNMAFVWIWPSLFAYQTVVEATPTGGPSELLRAEQIASEYREWDRAAA